MAPETPKPPMKEFSLSQRLVNLFANLVPEARAHIGKASQALHSEVDKLVGDFKAGTLGNEQLKADLETAQRELGKMGQLVKELADAKHQINELANELMGANAQIKDLTAQLEAAKTAAPASTVPTDKAAPQGAASGENSAPGGQG